MLPLPTSLHIVGQPPVERVCVISRAISDQEKWRTFATLGQVAREKES
jgi:hypothetical protein